MTALGPTDEPQTSPADAVAPSAPAEGGLAPVGNQTILAVEGLNVVFATPKGPIAAVRDAAFQVAAGETLAIVGESGSGKSVTALSTLGLLPSSATVTGAASYRGDGLIGADEPTLRRIRGNEISMIFQEPMTSLNPLHVVERQVSESLKLHQGLEGDAARARVIELLDQVGIRDPESRLASYPHQLSGGQRQRVMIAMALANNPNLLIADEPTTALDVTIQAQILKLLKDLQRERGMAMVFITHDLGIVRKIADQVCVMKDGEIVERGATAALFDAPRHPYTQRLLAAEPKGSAKPLGDDLEEVASLEDVKVWFPIKRGLLRRTVGHIKAVKTATLNIRGGETLGVVGESGSGKTTLGLALLRLISSEGRIVFLGRETHALGPREVRPLRRHMQVVFQDPYGSLSPRMSVAQIIGEGLDVHGLDQAGGDRRALIADALTEVGLDPESMDRYPHEFSGGQRQRVSIARAMILKPRLMVLDEPTSALDMTVQTQIVDLLRGLQETYGLAYLFISHDLKVVRAMSHRIMVMRAGEIVEHGATEDVVLRPQTDYTRALMAAAFDLETTPAAEEAG